MVFKYLNVAVQKDPSDRHFVITTISRLTAKKGLFYVIDALKILLQRGYTATLNIIGDGKYQKRLKEYAKGLEIHDHVNFHGLRTHEEILEILKRTDVFVQVSITIGNGLQEGIPNALKEAMARGIPVIGTYHAGIPEIVIPFVTGLLVPERDAESIVDSVLYYRQQQEQKDIIRKNARALIRNQHDIRVVNRKLETVLLRLRNEQIRVKKNFLINFERE